MTVLFSNSRIMLVNYMIDRTNVSKNYFLLVNYTFTNARFELLLNAKIIKDENTI